MTLGTKNSQVLKYFGTFYLSTLRKEKEIKVGWLRTGGMIAMIQNEFASIWQKLLKKDVFFFNCNIYNSILPHLAYNPWGSGEVFWRHMIRRWWMALPRHFPKGTWFRFLNHSRIWRYKRIIKEIEADKRNSIETEGGILASLGTIETFLSMTHWGFLSK